MEESWQTTPPSSESSAWIISQESPSPLGPKISIRTIVIIVVVVLMLGTTGSVVFMISQTTQTLNKAAEKQANEINNIVEEGSKPDSSFNLVGQVQAEDYQNPTNPDTSYANPFNDTQNPFK